MSSALPLLLLLAQTPTSRPVQPPRPAPTRQAPPEARADKPTLKPVKSKDAPQDSKQLLQEIRRKRRALKPKK